MSGDVVDQASQNVDEDEVAHYLDVEQLPTGLVLQIHSSQPPFGLGVEDPFENLDNSHKVNEIEHLRNLQILKGLVERVEVLQKDRKGESGEQVHPEPTPEIPQGNLLSRCDKVVVFVQENSVKVDKDIEQENN